MGLPLFGGVSDAFIYDVFFGGGLSDGFGGCVTWVSQISLLFQGANEKNTAMGQQRSSLVAL